MSLRPYKFIVQAIVQEVDDDGEVTREVEANPIVLYGTKSLVEMGESFADELAAHQPPPEVKG